MFFMPPVSLSQMEPYKLHNIGMQIAKFLYHEKEKNELMWTRI